jgi:hypothetical protein
MTMFRTRRLLEIAIEIALALAFVIGLCVYVTYGPQESPIASKWIAFALNTVIVFGYGLKARRPLWRKPKLWLVITALLLVHVSVGWSVIHRLESVPLIWYVPIVMGELSAVFRVIDWAFTEDELARSLPPLDTPQR